MGSVASGDEESFSLLMNTYFSLMYAFVLKMTGDKNITDDVLQDVFLKVWRNAKRYRHTGNLKAWIFSIARNTTIDQLRKRHLNFTDLDQEDEFFSDNIEDETLLPPEIFEKKELQDSVQSTLYSIPLIHREMLTLRYISELSLAEISEVTGLSLNNVKSRLRRAHIKFRESIINATKTSA